MNVKFIFAAIASCFITPIYVQSQNPQSTGNKILIVYFSHSGNTRVVANQIQELTGGDIFEIQPVNAYPTDYQTVVDQAKKEINTSYKPPLKTSVKNFESYDIIMVGSPNWWSTIAPPVAAFLTSYNFEGKTIVPFMTHGGGGMGHSVACKGLNDLF